MFKIIHVFYIFMHTSLFHIGVVNRYKYYCKIITRFRGGSIFVGFVWTSHQRINVPTNLKNLRNQRKFTTTKLDNAAVLFLSI